MYCRLVLVGICLMINAPIVSAGQFGQVDNGKSINTPLRKEGADKLRFQELQAAFPKWTVEWNPQAPGKFLLSGQSIRLSGRELENGGVEPSLLDYLRNRLASVVDIDVLELASGTSTDHGKFKTITFPQLYRGIPVESKGLKAVVDGHNSIVLLSGDLVEEISVSTAPALDSSLAAQSALSGLRGASGAAIVDCYGLVIVVTNDGTQHLGYKFSIMTETPPGGWMAYVDASTGLIVSRIDLSCQANGDIQGHIYGKYHVWDNGQVVVRNGAMPYAAEQLSYQVSLPGNQPLGSTLVASLLSWETRTTPDFFSDEAGYFHYSGIVGQNDFELKCGIGTPVCSVLVQDDYPNGPWYSPRQGAGVHNIANGTTLTQDFDWTGYENANINLFEGWVMGQHVSNMEQYFADLIGPSIAGSTVRRVTRIRDQGLPGRTGGAIGESVLGKWLYFAPLVESSPNDAIITAYHEMAHSVMYYNIGPLIPRYWNEGQAMYYSSTRVDMPDYHFGNSLYNAGSRELNSSSDPYVIGGIIAGSWWDLRSVLGVSAADQLVFLSGLFDITDLAHSMQSVLLADDDDGDLSNGTPHLNTIVNSFRNRWLGPTAPKLFYGNSQFFGHSPVITLQSAVLNTFSVYETYPWDSLVWSFGDGSASVNSLTPLHLYASKGTFPISCKAYYPWGQTEDLATALVDGEDILTVAQQEGCSEAAFQVDVSLKNDLATSRIQLPVRYDGAVHLALDHAELAGLRSEGMTLTIDPNLDLPDQHLIFYVIEGSTSVPILPAGEGPILRLFFTAVPPNDRNSSTSIRLQSLGEGAEPRVDHGATNLALTLVPGGFLVTYRPGDANGDNVVTSADATYVINYVFNGGPAPAPLAAGDANGDGHVNVSDAVFLVNYVSRGGPAPLCSPIQTLPKNALSDGAIGSLIAQFDGNITTLKLDAPTDLYGLQLKIVKRDAAAVTSLVSGVELLSNTVQKVTTVGLLDPNGVGGISAQQSAILTVDGEVEIVEAIGADRYGNTVELSIGPSAKDNQVPETFSLSQNYPNPFNPYTEISFSLPTGCEVKLEIFNIAGQLVTTVASGRFEAGLHSVTWRAGQVSSGVYFYRLEAGSFTETRKMILLK